MKGKEHYYGVLYLTINNCQIKIQCEESRIRPFVCHERRLKFNLTIVDCTCQILSRRTGKSVEAVVSSLKRPPEVV